MHKWTVRSAQAVLVGVVFAAAGAGVANADSTSDNNSIARGNQVQVPITAPITAPITVTGTPLNLLSRGNATVSGQTSRSARFSYKYRTIDNSGAVNAAGSNADNATGQKAPAAPIIICGNAMSSEGIGSAACRGHAFVSDQQAEQPASEPLSCGACAAAPAQQAAPAQPAAPAAPPCAAKAPAPAAHAAPAAPAAHAAPAAPAVPPCAAKAAAPVVAPAAHAARQIAPGHLTVIRHYNTATPVAPITICGNAGTLRGIASAACDGDAAFQKAAPAQHPMIGAAS